MAKNQSLVAFQLVILLLLLSLLKTTQPFSLWVMSLTIQLKKKKVLQVSSLEAFRQVSMGFLKYDVL